MRINCINLRVYSILAFQSSLAPESGCLLGKFGQPAFRLPFRPRTKCKNLICCLSFSQHPSLVALSRSRHVLRPQRGSQLLVVPLPAVSSAFKHGLAARTALHKISWTNSVHVTLQYSDCHYGVGAVSHAPAPAPAAACSSKGAASVSASASPAAAAEAAPTSLSDEPLLPGWPWLHCTDVMHGAGYPRQWYSW